MPGGETQWQPLVGGPVPFPIGPSIYGQMVFEDSDWDWRTFKYDVDLAVAKAKLGEVMYAMDPDLRPFKSRGGKLILYHGWSDFGISPEATRHAAAVHVSEGWALERHRQPRRRRELRLSGAVRLKSAEKQ